MHLDLNFLIDKVLFNESLKYYYLRAFLRCKRYYHNPVDYF